MQHRGQGALVNSFCIDYAGGSLLQVQLTTSSHGSYFSLFAEGGISMFQKQCPPMSQSANFFSVLARLHLGIR